MKNVMVLFINGKMFLFQDCGYGSDEVEQLERRARNALNEYPALETLDNNTVCEWYVQSVEDHLGIILKKLNISFIIRINK